jgi:fibronectin type 3 domain-containing protein
VRPGSLALTEQDDDVLRISWDAIGLAETYSIYRTTAAGGPWMRIATGTTAPFYDDDVDGELPGPVGAPLAAGLSSAAVQCSWEAYAAAIPAGATWYYQVAAAGAGCEGLPGAVVEGSISAVVKGYVVYRGGQPLTATLGIDATGYTDAVLLPNTSAAYQIAVLTADDLHGPLSCGTTAWTHAAQPSLGTAAVYWNETDLFYTNLSLDANNNSAETEYAVTIDSGGYGAWWVQADNLIGLTTYWAASTAWTHKYLEAGATAYYKVKARNHDGIETALSDERAVYVASLPGPLNFRALGKTDSEIIWRWDDAASENAYQVYASSGALLAGIPQDTVAWTETGLAQNTQYVRYATLTHPVSGESLPSNTTECFTLMSDPVGIAYTMIGASSITIRSSSLVTNISSGSSGAYFTNTTRSEVSGWLHTDTWMNVNLLPNTRYSFIMRLRNADGIETTDTPVSSRYTMAAVPGAPILYKTKDTNFQIILQENGNPGSTEYAIKISTAPSGTVQYAQYAGTYAVRGTTVDYRTKAVWGESILLTGLSGSSTYYVTVTARNAAGSVTADSALATIITMGYAPGLASDWDSTNGHHVHVRINTGTHTEDTEYAILHTAGIGIGLWLDGSGSTQPSPYYLTKAQWEIIPHRNAHIELDPGSQHKYRAQSRNPATGETADSAEGVVYTLLDAPSGVSAQEMEDDYLRIAWNPVADAAHYQVYAATASGGAMTYLGISTSTNFAHDIDGSRPEKATGLAGVVLSSTSIAVSWLTVPGVLNSAPRYYAIAAGNANCSGVLSSECGGFVSPVIAGYRVYRNSVLAATVSSSTVAWDDTGRLPSTQYIYQVSAVSSDALESELSEPVTCVTFPQDMAKPEDVIGMRVLSIANNVIRVSFSAVRRRVDGSEIGNCLKGYGVYRAQELHGPWERLRFIGPQEAREFTDTFSEGIQYYCVRAVDVYNQEGNATMLVDTQTDIVIISVDGRVNMAFDNESKAVFVNAGSDIRIKILEDTPADSMLMHYTISAYDDADRPLDSSIVERYRLGPLLTFRFGTNISAQARALASSNLKPALFWHNTVKWVKVNGDLDTGSSVLSLRSKIFGRYSVQYAVVPTKFGVASVEPKIFSPDESDSVVSRVRFFIDNPGSSEITARIFDRKGQLIKANLPRELETVIYWDGRDVNGKVVPSGIYIYQIEADNKVINGTVVVAR